MLSSQNNLNYIMLRDAWDTSIELFVPLPKTSSKDGVYPFHSGGDQISTKAVGDDKYHRLLNI
jgi:hypothetical protein